MSGEKRFMEHIFKTISSAENPLAKRLAKLTTSKGRKEQALFIADGEKLAKEAVDAGLEIVYVIVTPEGRTKYAELTARAADNGAQALVLYDHVFAKLSGVKTPQGILLVCRTPRRGKVTELESQKKYIALEGLQDPGNIGTILRTAEALGIDGVILDDACCDVFSQKALRGAMGAAFRIPLLFVDRLTALFEAGRLNILAADIKDDALDVRSAFDGGCVVVIGNEGNGISQLVREQCKAAVTIRMAGRAESLNAAAAAGIIMWEMTRGSL